MTSRAEIIICIVYQTSLSVSVCRFVKLFLSYCASESKCLTLLSPLTDTIREKNDAHSNDIYFFLSVHVPCKKCIALCLRKMISVVFILKRVKEAHSLPDLIFHKHNHVSHQV